MTAGLLPAGWTDWSDASKQALLDEMTGKVVAMRSARWRPYPWQVPPRPLKAQEMYLAIGGRGCVAPWTRVYVPGRGHVRIDVLTAEDRPVTVLTLSGPAVTAGAPFRKGLADLWTVTTDDGCQMTVTDQHRFLTPHGWQRLADVRVGQQLAGGAPVPSAEPATSVLRWTEIVSVRASHRGPYFDLHVPDAEHYAAEGLWNHNTGKTENASRYVTQHVAGPPCDTRLKGGHRVAIVAPTLGDAVESCVEGPSGLRAMDSRVQLIGGAGGSHVRFPNGSQGKLFGAFTPEDVERLRSGGNRCLVWLEELAAMRRLSGVLEHTRLGLRIGSSPHYVASTTPKPRKELRQLIADPRTLLTHGRTSQAYHLDAQVRAVYEEMYAGTRLGRQELEGEMLDDVEGALWAWWMFDVDGFRVDPADVDSLELDRVVVSVDPATTSGEHSDSSGLVVAGRGRPPGHDRTADTRPRGYVLHSQSVRMTPEKTMQVAARLFYLHEADCIVIEANNGGDYLPAVLRQVDPTVPVRLIHASRGKHTRAEPVAALYEQARVSHCGTAAAFLSLEDQLTSWTGESGQDSPDEMDALCHAMHDLLVAQAPAATGRVRDRRFAGRR